jgi:hydroxyethylthiazole kinase-like uncharacterized protein yjeF
MRYIVTADEMRALDAMTIEQLGLPGAVLMENAGRRVVEVIMELLAERAAPDATVAVVCGGGNNGGDGYVIARCLRDHGVDAAVYLAASSDKLAGDARLHCHVYQAAGHPIFDVSNSRTLALHAAAIETADVVVDALFGTGLARPIGGHYREVIETINHNQRGLRVAVDIPSGLSCDTGQVLGVAVEAHVTVTMAFLKLGLCVAPGFPRAGTVHVAEIGIPEALAARHGVATMMLEPRDLAALVPIVTPLDHKNRRGHLLAIAGSPGKRGAARLMSLAGLRAGAGLVTLAWPFGGHEPVAPDPVMTENLDADDLLVQTDPDAMRSRLQELERGKHALAMGPGMPVSQAGHELVRLVLRECEVPMVLDADALNHIGSELERVRGARAAVVLTPHPGEAARLLGTTSADIETDRMAAVRRLARESAAVVVLKGARTLIACGLSGERHGRVVVNQSGNPGLATAGSGDVLTGIIGALLAQGMDAFDAACLGVYIHGRTGDLAAEALFGPHAVTAADLSERIAAVFGELVRAGARR